MKYVCTSLILTACFPGHVIYEMSAGKPLESLVPTEEDLRDVEDEKCRMILRYIFTRKKDGEFMYTIEEVRTCAPIKNINRKHPIIMDSISLDSETSILQSRSSK